MFVFAPLAPENHDVPRKIDTMDAPHFHDFPIALSRNTDRGCIAPDLQETGRHTRPYALHPGFNPSIIGDLGDDGRLPPI
jgi:hypothetical protein